MKTIINSSDMGMSIHWTNLVQVEKKDKALRTVQKYGDIKSQTHPVGSYLIETQVNQSDMPISYYPISVKKAEKFMAMPIEQAIEEMEREMT
jgi:hypothetical protein